MPVGGLAALPEVRAAKVTVIKAVPDSAASMYVGAAGITVSPDGQTVYALSLRAAIRAP
jgi:hypothetical protein